MSQDFNYQTQNGRDPLPTMDYPGSAPYFAPSEPDLHVTARIKALADEAFTKCLVSAILANFPIASIFAIFLGNAGLKVAKKATEYAEEHGTKTGGKNIIAKILGNVGKWLGLYNTVVTALLVAFYVIYFLFIMILMIASEM